MKGPMEQDERTVILQAQDAARQSLLEHGRVLPAAVMLVQIDPISEVRLDVRRAIRMGEDKPFETEEQFEAFVGGLRAEALRLQATAVALIGEAAADIVDGAPRRVALIRHEDATGVQLMHAPIDGNRTGDFMPSPEAPDILDQPILPVARG